MRRIKKPKEETELNITSFMNLMIVLVPVLLLNMVFSQTMVLDIKLPASTNSPATPPKESFDIGLKVFSDSFLVTFNNKALKKIPQTEGKYDYKALSTYLQSLKVTVEEKMNANKKDGEEYKYKKDILVSFRDDADYQVLVKTMDTVRSYPTVIAASVVQAELMPDVSLGGLDDKEVAPTLAGEG